MGLMGAADESDAMSALLQDIPMLFIATGGGPIFSRTLVGALNNLGDRPWRELPGGAEITEPWLAKTLRRFGIRRRTIRSSRAVAKGYMEEDFKEAFQRYMCRSDMEAHQATLQARHGSVNGAHPI